MYCLLYCSYVTNYYDICVETFVYATIMAVCLSSSIIVCKGIVVCVAYQGNNSANVM